MKGLELAERFYEEFGKPMLEEQFGHILPYLAAGLAGSGSECSGYDDEFSRDHDFEPAFCIFIPDEDVVDRKCAFELERAYSKLPKEFMGICRSFVNAVGGNRHGVIRIGDFFESKTGSRDGKLSIDQWFSIPEYSLAEAVNGAVFFDNYGEFSRIREALSCFPQEVMLKKLAGNLLLMGQAGQYNYQRCISRGETAAAQLAVFEFAKSAANVAFLLNRKYMPYYKWCFRALREISPECKELADCLEMLISSGNSEETARKKRETIEEICLKTARGLQIRSLTDIDTAEMEQQAYAVNSAIKDGRIRNMHILCGI